MVERPVASRALEVGRGLLCVVLAVGAVVSVASEATAEPRSGWARAVDEDLRTPGLSAHVERSTGGRPAVAVLGVTRGVPISDGPADDRGDHEPELTVQSVIVAGGGLLLALLGLLFIAARRSRGRD